MSNIHGALKLRSQRIDNGELPVQPGRYNLRPWSTYELSTLRKMSSLGAEGVATLLGRSVGSVKRAAQRHRISLRTPGSRAGITLGQPRGVSYKRSFKDVKAEKLTELREALLDGTVDIRRLEERAAREAKLSMGAPLCPSCACNPIEVETTGYCRDCHIRKLAEAHRLESESESQRELWAERQAKVRRRRREAQEEEAV